MGEILIDIKGASKKFSRKPKFLRAQGLRRVSRLMFGLDVDRTRLLDGEFWAVKDVSFSVERGEAIALLGLNGSGKSTLLKIISRLLLPDSGEITVRGRVESLIELGAGFHQNLTGRENVLLKAGLRGLSHKQASGYLSKVIEFAELKDSIDSPIKNYSSGMIARLGFACAIQCEPDVLLVDEVLSVGDFEFRQKCLAYINSIREKTAIIFVSHSMGQVQLFCKKGIVLVKGENVGGGPVRDAIDLYLQQQSKTPSQTGSALGEQFENPERLNDLKVKYSKSREWGAESTNAFFAEDPIFFHVEFKLPVPAKQLIVGLPIYNFKNDCVTAPASDNHQVDFKTNSGGAVRFAIELDNKFNEGTYTPALAVMDSAEYLVRKHLPPFKVLPRSARDIGFVRMEQKWIVQH